MSISNLFSDNNYSLKCKGFKADIVEVDTDIKLNNESIGDKLTNIQNQLDAKVEDVNIADIRTTQQAIVNVLKDIHISLFSKPG